jgi:hypothetical protein
MIPIIIFTGVVVVAILFALTWFGSEWFSHLATKGFYMVRGNDGVSASVRPEFHTAKGWADEGQIEKAIRIAIAEEAKEPGHYEGNLLLCQWFCQVQKHRQGLACIERILNNPSTTRDQATTARDWKRRLEEFIREKEMGRN